MLTVNYSYISWLFAYLFVYSVLMNMVQRVKNPFAMQETQEMQVRSLSREDPLEEEIATHSSFLA